MAEMDINSVFLKDHKRFRKKNKNLYLIFLVLALLVAVIVFWWLKLVGITITGDTFCGLEEHTHSDECYTAELICTPDDIQIETGETEGVSHTHSDDCYSKTLTCTKPVHTHSRDCYPDTAADTEAESDWKKTFENVVITNDVAQNLSAIAQTQVGYTESVKNLQFDPNGIKHGYTRYGEWYGNPYAEWDTLFVSFCLNYANANNVEPLLSANAEIMRSACLERGIYAEAESYKATNGDIIFFDLDSDSRADRTGIVSYYGEDSIIVIEGDAEDTVASLVYTDTDTVMGYAMTGELYEKSYISETSEEESSDETLYEEFPGKVNRYIAKEDAATVSENSSDVQYVDPEIFKNEPLTTFQLSRASITNTSHLEDELVDAVFKDTQGNVIPNNGTIYVGQDYIVSLEFSEVNSGSSWIQFKHDEDGYLTYHIPQYLHCDPFTEWHPISATTEYGTVENVGEYFVDTDGLLRVRFYEDANGVNFVDKYSNVDFSIEFSTTVDSTLSGTTQEIVFSDKIHVDLNVDGSAAMDLTKTHGSYDSEDHTMEYTIRVEATQGVVRDLVIDDQIWDTQYTLRDTILVTDLDGNVITPQPTVSDHPSHNNGAEEGFRISGFPDFKAGEGFLITYKTQLYDYVLSGETVDLWNGLDSNAKDSIGNNIYKWAEDWQRVELEKLEKDGKQTVIKDANGNDVSVVEWNVVIMKTDNDLAGTVVIDTLGPGLAYYTGRDIAVKRFDEWGGRLPDTYISWNDVTVNGGSMSFELPEGYGFELTYYTTHEALDEGELKYYTNTVTTTINNREEVAGSQAAVIGFIPKVTKGARGNDGEYVYFTIETDVPSVIKDWGHFYLTDMAAFWNYNGASLYVENLPQDMVITAVTESGDTVTFTPYVEGGTTENTYILIAPAEGDLYHSFNILFNTADQTFESSKWILDENAKLTITYKLPFDAKTGTEWSGEPAGDLILEDVLLAGYPLSNEAYLNYTDVITGVGSTNYEYSPKIIKKSIVHDDGTIDYSVVFNNTIPGSGGNDGYLDNGVGNAVFNDSFDERLEYVPGSLIVTTYAHNSNTWIAKYQYNGNADGNSITADSTDFVFYDYNEDSGVDWIAGAKNFNEYYRWTNRGGRFVFDYKLKVKDEYMYTTEHSMFVLDNTAELTWDDGGTSGPVTERTEYETGLIDKHVAQQGTNLDFDIHINRGALDILEGSDTLTIEDTMTKNLSVYWESIVLLYEDSQGNWVDFASDESRYSYTVTYDPPTNKLTFVVPDSLHIRVDYTTLITENGLVSVNNAVKIEGKAEVSDVIDAVFKVEDHSGDASGSIHKITLLKQDGITDIPLPNAEFLLYGPMGDPDAQPPAGSSDYVVAHDGSYLRYIGSYTTGPDGSVIIETQYLTLGGPYALVERTAPEGYELLDKPVFFYFYETDPNGQIQTVTTLIDIENFKDSFLIPETGGCGTLPLTIIGVALTAAPILYSIIRRKRERRLL